MFLHEAESTTRTESSIRTKELKDSITERIALCLPVILRGSPAGHGRRQAVVSQLTFSCTGHDRVRSQIEFSDGLLEFLIPGKPR